MQMIYDCLSDEALRKLREHEAHLFGSLDASGKPVEDPVAKLDAELRQKRDRIEELEDRLRHRLSVERSK